MNKKSLLILSSILAGSLLVGGTFAAYAVTDTADPFGIYVTPGDLPEDETDYVTLNWGENSSLNSIGSARPDNIYKLGIVSLKSNLAYEGVLTVTLTDESGKAATAVRFIDYLKLYLYEGANNEVEEGSLPTGQALASTSLKEYTLEYTHAQGTSSGKEYSIYVEFVNLDVSKYNQILSDVVDISVDWSAQGSDINEDDKTVYFSTNWDRCFLYAWNGEAKNATWPGVELSKAGLNQYGQYVYKGTVLSDYTKIIFNNGNGSQTGDIVLADYATYFAQGDQLFWLDNNVLGRKTIEDSDITNFASNIADNPGPILQAWGWTTEYVRTHLDDIKEAGFKAVQLSPLQPISTNNVYNWNSYSWNTSYRPVDLTVAPSYRNPFGDRTSLTTLCNEARAKGIDIMVDVITNHVVDNYTNYLHSSDLSADDDGNLEKIVRGWIGLPDLQTENSFIQGKVIAMLEDYIDCGVAGFRFDAAKHIETPKDGYFASNFWPNIINAVNKHGIEVLGKAPYSYGEILGIGAGRDWYGYTDYIDVTDISGNVSAVREEFYNHNVGQLLSRTSYNMINRDNKYAVVFAESHDDYVSNHTDNTTGGDGWMNLQYAYHTARSEFSSVYFARPSENNRVGNDTTIVVTPCDGYKSNLVRAVNALHNEFYGGSEYLYVDYSVIVNKRQLGDKVGIFVASLSEWDVASKAVGGIPDGVYEDIINVKQDGTYNTYTASNGVINAPLTSGAMVLIRK